MSIFSFTLIMARAPKKQQPVKKSKSKKSASKARVKVEPPKCTHWLIQEDRTCRKWRNPSSEKYCTGHLDEIARRSTVALSPLEASTLALLRKYDLTQEIYDETSQLVESVLRGADPNRHPAIDEVNAWEAAQAFKSVLEKVTISLGNSRI
ncbi:hypothetical protein GN244_ATG18312 [Phytophthora infestans]|uniref:Uncharacterized protein n=1 Tax=Phytophthora infestans TaxID=4787 RepID=A0A833WDT7_PHYIN|nr:hypothetical protein GN244_ATG18312 [Phytophthora infestans]KAF4134156.1 hypothetical protein GN958_ATG16631 [Phytophthora infestans]KAF4134158.1 hypothetical protein GN958_ATG16633 [Phytophthora infestans]